MVVVDVVDVVVLTGVVTTLLFVVVVVGFGVGGGVTM